MERFEGLRHRLVHFRIQDTYLPEPPRLALELHGEDLLQGVVIDVSDGGALEEAYVVVRIDGVREPIVVPTAAIRGAL